MKVKKVLVLTDGSKETVKMAAGIADGLKGINVLVKSAVEFKGNDILPAEAFFLGCEKPEPDTFAYITDLFKHINLVGRPCGVFSPGSDKAAKYLAGLIKDSEAALKGEPFTGSVADIGKWAKGVVSGSL